MADTDAPTSSAEASPKSPILFKLVIALFLVAVVATECLVAYLFLPSAGAAAAMPPSSASEGKATSGASAAAHSEKHSSVGDSKEGEAHEDKRGHHETESNEAKEVDLGEFTVTSTQPSSSSTLRITLHLYGVVSDCDEHRFQTRMKEVQHRFREQVLVTLRGAEVSDLTDAGLGLLKRTILEKTNVLLKEPLLKSVIFSEFSFFEM